jgi:hypothetical protein
MKDAFDVQVADKQQCVLLFRLAGSTNGGLCSEVGMPFLSIYFTMNTRDKWLKARNLRMRIKGLDQRTAVG